MPREAARILPGRGPTLVVVMASLGARAVSAIIGTPYTGAALGNLVGPWATGRLFDATGSYAAAVAGVGLLALASALAAWQAVRQR